MQGPGKGTGNVDVVFRFALDSSVEGSGFEPSVPHQKDNAFEASPAPASRFVADRCKEGPLGDGRRPRRARRGDRRSRPPASPRPPPAAHAGQLWRYRDLGTGPLTRWDSRTLERFPAPFDFL